MPPPLQRMLADDLLAAVFPDAAACLENIPGDRQMPDHPLVAQTVRDCLEEAMDFAGLAALLTRIHAGELALVTRDTPEPSPLVARDSERASRTRFWTMRRSRSGGRRPCTRGAPASRRRPAISVRSTRRRSRACATKSAPDPRDADELHDALVTAGFLTARGSGTRCRRDLFAELVAVETRPARSWPLPARTIWIAAERLPELLGRSSGRAAADAVDSTAPASRRLARVDARRGDRRALSRPPLDRRTDDGTQRWRHRWRSPSSDADAALVALETEGVVLRGRFSGADELEWCDRRLLARIHRYTLNRLRAEIEPVSAADFQRFLFAWHGVDPRRISCPASTGSATCSSAAGRFRVAGQRVGTRGAAGAPRPLRPVAWLDMLCLTGEVGLGTAERPRPAHGADRKPSLRVALFLREHADAWQALAFRDRSDAHGRSNADGERRRRCCETLRARGASFLRRARRGVRDRRSSRGAPRSPTLAAAGLVVSDGFAGVRAVIRTLRHRPTPRDRRQRSGRALVARSQSSRPARDREAGDRDAGAGAARALRHRLPAPARARNECRRRGAR